MKTRKQSLYERRGTMIYVEGNSRKGSAKYVAECKTVDEAQSVVQRLNELTDVVNSGLSLADVMCDTRSNY